MKTALFQLCLIFSALGSLKAIANASADFNAAVIALNKGRTSEARATFQRLYEANPDNGLYLFNLGSAEFNLQNFADAAFAFRKVIALKSPLTPAATLFLAKSLRRNGEFEAAQKTLSLLQNSREITPAQIEMENALLKTARTASALAYYRQKNYAKVLTVLDGQFDEGDVYLLKGLSELRLGRFQEASDNFRLALARPNTGESHGQSRFFLEQVNSRQGDSDIWAYGDLGLGYNSNVFLDGKTESPVGRFASQLNVAGGWQWRTIRPWLVSAAYSFYWEETPSATSGRFLSHSLRTPLGFQNEHWLVNFIPSLQFQTLETQPYLLRAGLGTRVRHTWENFSLGFTYDWAKQFAQISGASYLDGRVHSATLTAGYLLGQSKLEAGLVVLIDDIGDLHATDGTLPLAGSGIGPQLRGFWYPSPSSELEVSITFLTRSYRVFATPDNKERSDTQQRANVRFTHTLGTNLRGFISCSAILNVSSLDASSALDDKNYTQIVTLAGVSWEILN